MISLRSVSSVETSQDPLKLKCLVISPKVNSPIREIGKKRIKLAKTKRRKCKRYWSGAVAPNNTTDFIMKEHDMKELQDPELPVLKLSRPKRESQPQESPATVEDDMMLSSTMGFYEDCGSLMSPPYSALPKCDLIQMCIELEDGIRELESEIRSTRQKDQQKIREPSPVDDDEEDRLPGEVPINSETAIKIEVFNSEINKLIEQNRHLKKENQKLVKKVHPDDSSNLSDDSCSSRDSDPDSTDSEDKSLNLSYDDFNDSGVVASSFVSSIGDLSKDEIT